MQRPKCMPAGLICTGGLDSIKDEMWFMQAHGCLQRGISMLMIDGPGRVARCADTRSSPAPTAKCRLANCIDWLEQRPDVDRFRIAVCGSSFGGYCAARFEIIHDRPLARAANGCEAAQ